MNKNNLLIAASLALFCLTSSAATVPSSNYFDGFYVGAGLDYGTAFGKIKANVTDTEEIWSEGLLRSKRTRSYSLDKSKQANGLGGELFFGYGKTIAQPIYLGLELAVRYLPLTLKVANTASVNGIPATTTVKVTNQASSDLALRIGWLITPKIMLYGQAGLNASYYTVDYEHSGGNELPTIPQAPGSKKKFTRDNLFFAFAPGIGVAAMLSNNVAVRLQDVYVLPQHSSKYNSANSAQGNFTPSDEWYVDSAGNTSFNSATNIVTLAVVYHFNSVA